MFDFFDNRKNPLMFLMNMMEKTGGSQEETPEEKTADASPMLFVQQAFMAQMQMMQNMLSMQMQFMQGMADIMHMTAPGEGAAEPKAAAGPDRRGGFKMGNWNVPPELLRKLMQMDMTPENLEKLQRVLDFVFEAMPSAKQE